MINSKLYSIEQLINVNSIKYDRLSEMVNVAYAGSGAEEINIFFDLYSILKPLYKQDLYTIDNYSLITSCIINMIAHYRDFFRTRYRVESKFYLIYSDNCPVLNKTYFYGYNKSNELQFGTKKKINDMVKFNTDNLLKLLSPYLPDVQYVNTTFEVGAAILDIIFRNQVTEPNIPNLIITKDIYNYQLAYHPSVTIFRPKKANGEDTSYFINMHNVMDIYMADRKCNVKTTLPPILLPAIMALSRVPERGMKSLFNISTVVRTLEKAVQDYIIGNNIPVNEESVQYILNADILNSIGNGRKIIQADELKKRLSVVDLKFQQKMFMQYAPESKYQFVNLYDPEGVKAINNKYFSKNPLDLNRL